MSEKRPCTQRFNQLAHKGLTKILQSKKGHNLVKVGVIGLCIQGQLMIQNKCVKFKSKCLRKGLACKGLTGNSNAYADADANADAKATPTLG